jgi:hypothetical protein
MLRYQLRVLQIQKCQVSPLSCHPPNATAARIAAAIGDQETVGAGLWSEAAAWVTNRRAGC